MEMNAYQEATKKTANYPERAEIRWDDQLGCPPEVSKGLTYVALKLNGEAGEFAEKVGKLMRDQNGNIDWSDREALGKELGDVLWYVARAARELMYTLDDIAAMNLKKLEDRAARGTLLGSGDDR